MKMSSATTSTGCDLLGQANQHDRNLSAVHFLPCTIDFDGPVPVNSFFQVTKSKSDLKAAFRGRELVGKEMKLPVDVLGVNAIQNRPKESSETSWDCVGQFDKITVWQHDVAPDLGQLQDCIDWFEIAEQVKQLVHQCDTECPLYLAAVPNSTHDLLHNVPRSGLEPGTHFSSLFTLCEEICG